jgi:hypothetical protein
VNSFELEGGAPPGALIGLVVSKMFGVGGAGVNRHVSPETPKLSGASCLDTIISVRNFISTPRHNGADTAEPPPSIHILLLSLAAAKRQG